MRRTYMYLAIKYGLGRILDERYLPTFPVVSAAGGARGVDRDPGR